MTALAHGRAVITTIGALTESLWTESPAVLVAPATDLKKLVALGSQLVSDLNLRIRLATAGEKLYESNFTINHTIERLRAPLNGTCPISPNTRTT
jgi:hypothetical protein